jgi:hypothetical protein
MRLDAVDHAFAFLPLRNPVTTAPASSSQMKKEAPTAALRLW